MAITKIESGAIQTGAVSVADISDNSITLNKLHTEVVPSIIADITDSAPATLDTLNELAAALGDDPNFATTTANNIATKLPLAGGTMTGTIEFGDSSGADGDANLHFGASQDLQIYHNGTHSFIYDKGQGQLRLRSNYFHVLNGSNNASSLEAKQGLGVHLYHNGDQKIETTATGVEVTGATRSSQPFFVNSQSVTENYTIAVGDSAMAAGPVTIESGSTVTISSGSRWVIV